MIPLPANDSENESAAFYDDTETCATPVDVTLQPSNRNLYSHFETSLTTCAATTDCDSQPPEFNETTGGIEMEPAYETVEDY